MWIRVDDDTIDHPKTHRLAELLSTDRASALGLLVGVWGYANRYHPDGDLTAVVLSSLHAKLGFTSGGVGAAVSQGRHTSVPALSLGPVLTDVREVLVQARFADRLEGGKIVLHDWDEYNGPNAEKRRNERERKALQRLRAKLTAAGISPESVPENVPRKSGTKTGRSHLRNDTVRSTPLPPVAHATGEPPKPLDPSIKLARQRA